MIVGDVIIFVFVFVVAAIVVIVALVDVVFAFVLIAVVGPHALYTTNILSFMDFSGFGDSRCSAFSYISS